MWQLDKCLYVYIYMVLYTKKKQQISKDSNRDVCIFTFVFILLFIRFDFKNEQSKK